MNLQQLRYFVELAHTQLLPGSRAAVYHEPSLSHAVTQLETELGVPLFERTGRATALTRYGDSFSPVCSRP